MATTSNLAFRPIHQIFGVEVLGIDFGSELTESLKEQLRDAYRRHRLLLFRGEQSATPETLDAVASIFGKVSSEGAYGGRPISNIAKEGVGGDGALQFHSDRVFTQRPLRGLLLYGKEVTPEGAGGETVFANAIHAYNLLPTELRNEIKDLGIVHTTPDDFPPVERATHSLVYAHPATGETVLFYSPRFFERFVGLDESKGRPLCQQLMHYLTQPNNLYTHQWRQADLIVWDNMALQHARTNFDPRHHRHLDRRQIIAGDLNS